VVEEQKPLSDTFAPMAARILAVEDFAPYRHFVNALLQRYPNFQVVGEAVDGLQAIEKARELKPDIVLLDIGLPELNGLDAARRIRENSPHTKIIFLTQESCREVIQEAINLGASGYVLKTNAELDLLPALQAALQGKQFFHGEVTTYGDNHHGQNRPR
jgi:DNA-binding NarL/FixJ family response regulator